MAGISDETYEQLQQILRRQNGKSYTLEEIKEIGNGLLEFLLLLIEIERSIKLDSAESMNISHPKL